MSTVKCLLLSVSLLLFKIAANGQEFTKSNIDDYLGTWQWISQLDTFSLRIRQIDTTIVRGRNKSLSFQVVGVHRYVRSGGLIESNFDIYPDTISAQVSLYGKIADDHAGQLHVFFHSFKDNVYFEGDLYPGMVNNKRVLPMNLTYPGEAPPDPNRGQIHRENWIPNQIVLTRIE